MNGIYLYFVNKHLPSWALLGLKLRNILVCMYEINLSIPFTIFTSKLVSSAIQKELNAPNYFPDKSHRYTIKRHISICSDKILFKLQELTASL